MHIAAFVTANGSATKIVPLSRRSVVVDPHYAGHPPLSGENGYGFYILKRPPSPWLRRSITGGLHSNAVNDHATDNENDQSPT